MPWAAAGTGLLFGLALVMLGLFFATKNERFDRVAEWSFVGFAILGIPTIPAVPARLADVGLAGSAVTAIGVAGASLIGLGELSTTL